MNVLEKAEKALEYLKSVEGSTKSHEVQAAAGTLGRCLGALGSRQNCARHYANLLHSAIPTLLALASNDSAEVRLVGDEALNRAVVGGFAFHSHKTNIILQNQIDKTKNARWIRAALTRICLGECWLRPGFGKIRSQALTLFPKLSQIVRGTNEIQLTLEALESNLNRILIALAEYTTDEEIAELSAALLIHVESPEPAVRRSAAACVAHLCAHRDLLLPDILTTVFQKLWPSSTDNSVVMAWFSVVKAIFQTNDVSKFAENNVFSVQDYLELYHLCMHYIHLSTEHNIQNAVLECLTTLLSQAKGKYRKALLEKHPRKICLDSRNNEKTHRRNISISSVTSRATPGPLSERDPELMFTGALQLTTPSLSVEDLTVQTPDSPASEMDMPLNSEHLSKDLLQYKDLSEKLQEFEETEREFDQTDAAFDGSVKVNIGSLSDDDVPLKYCARLLASKFLLTGNNGGLIPDRVTRVSVKSSALNCMSEILQLYPQVVTVYLDKDADSKTQNISGSSENTDSNQDNINDFILERNVCYQDSLTDSLSQELFNRSMDSQSQSQHISKKDSKSLDKSLDKSVDSVEQKSSKDVPSNILDGKALVASALTDDTNPNMTNSNFTTNSNMSCSNDPTTGYPMTSSGDILTSSIDLDMKFDHFGESTTNLENEFKEKKKLTRTDEVKDEPEVFEKEVFEYQHMCDVFVLLEGHSDPQIRGLVRVCIGNYLSAALDLSHGDYSRWRNVSSLPKDISDNISAEKLVGIILKGLTDEIQSTVNHTLSALSKTALAISSGVSWTLLWDCVNSLVAVESNKYWLCRVNLCKLYEELPYHKLFLLYPGFYTKTKIIMDTLFRLLGDQDQRVRQAAAQTIANIIPKVYIDRRYTPTSYLAELTKQQSEVFKFDHKGLSLDLVRNMYFYCDLPEEMKSGEFMMENDGLKMVVGELMCKLMACNCKYYLQGLLECLQAICNKWLPWKHKEAYSDLGILSYCLDSLDYCSGTVVTRTLLLDICRLVYPVEIHNIMCHKTSDIFEPDSQSSKEKWQHLNERVGGKAEKFQQITLKMLNIVVHLIEDVNPNVHLNKSGIALPGSPVRRKTQDSAPRKSSISNESDDKGSLRKKLPVPATSLKANFAGHFFNEPFYMKLYENLRATYSNHKINLDPKSSIFFDYLTTVLNCLAIQLELSTEREFGLVTEELLFYLKVIMPLRPDLTVYCITQLLKCLFGTNMITEYNDFMTIEDKIESKTKANFFDDVMMINKLTPIEDESRRSSLCSNSSQKLSLDSKNPKMAAERQLLIAMENFAKNKMDRKWSTNKKELERYIRLFEPVVIQALKSYTMQNDIPLQCRVLSLLSQLLTLRVNYCMLDSEQIFIAFLIKQLEYVEQHEIPNCCELVNSIMMFLVQLSSSKHHTKQIIEIPKLIQLCDGLMASGAHSECIAGLEPVAVKVFSNMGGTSILGRQQQQEAQATREVLFYMLQKTMHEHKVLELVSCVLCLSREHPESFYRWSELAADTLLNLLAQASVEIDSRHAIASLERLLDSIYKDVLLEQSRVEILLKILFKAPPDQVSTSPKLKLRYLSIIMVLLRKVLVLIPESEILLSINYLKALYVSPHSIFFNVKTEIDPLNVLLYTNVSENCGNLSPDVILARFLFKTLTFAITEVDDHDSLDLKNGCDKGENGLLYSVCVNIIVQVKHMLHLTDGCLFPLTSKTAQTLLHNEQSGLNTGLYSPTENIPLDLLTLICTRAAHVAPLLTVHWSHLLIRLNFLSHKYWQKLVGYSRQLPLGADDSRLPRTDALQAACFVAYCEYFVENGLSEAVHLTWLLVNRVHVLISQYSEDIVRTLVSKVQENAGASGLLLQAVAARCQGCLQAEFALNTYEILSLCHESQSGALVFLICRIVGKLEPAIAVRFASLAVERCKKLKEMSLEDINVQLSKEDVQVALELLQRDKVYVRYSNLVVELNSLASSVFDLSPLDLSQDRAINPQYIVTTNVDDHWFINQVKSRCCQTDSTVPKIPKHHELAMLLLNLSKDELSTVLTCPEFDRKILSAFFKVTCDNYLKEFLNVVSVYELKEQEKDNAREQREMIKLHEEIVSSMDSNKLNVANALFKNNNKESKSQFFIPVAEVNEKFGNLELSEDDTELIPPPLSELYQVALDTFDKSLLEIIRLFPKQNRPLSQSENFNLTIEQTIDKYTRRCHQVFQDKLFHQEFLTIQTILNGFLDSLHRTTTLIDNTDCDLLEKLIENILPTSLAKNISIFSVISLQYLTFLIKNKKLVESPVHADVSFRGNVTVTDDVIVDNVIAVTVDNVSKALQCKQIWSELNCDSNVNRTQSAISCLYAIVKYLVKDTKPIALKKYIQTQSEDNKPDIIIIGDKLVTLIEYWEQNFYTHGASDVICAPLKKSTEKLLVSLARLDIVSNMALIPPLAWPSVEVVSKKDELQKIDLPLQALQDLDVLESFLFRVNLIGWSCKKQFEEVWVALLGALGGDGAHCAVRGITQLLVAARAARHAPRHRLRHSPGIQRLRNILVGTSFFDQLENINLERIPLLKDDFQGYHCAEYNADYLKLAADITDYAPYAVRKEVKRTRKNKEIDINSCLQLLSDMTAQMLDPKAPTGLAARTALLASVVYCSDVYSAAAQWRARAALLIALSDSRHASLQYSAAARALSAALQNALATERHTGLQDLSTVHQKLLKSLSSSYAPIRQAALHGCLLQLTGAAQYSLSQQTAANPYQELAAQLTHTVRASLHPDTKLSLYEQSLYWTVLFTLIELGHPDLINIAVDFVMCKPRHYCVDLVVKGISNTIRQQVLPKELKNNVIEKLMDNTKKYSEEHAFQILMVHLFSADSKLLSPKLTSDVSNMDPDILMNSMERITLLYKLLRKTKSREIKYVITTALKYFLRETLPPAATLSRVVIEFLETCKDSEKRKVIGDREKWIECAVLNAEVVFEVFETSVTQDQLPVLSGWIFEALCHLLHGKISPDLLPYCLLTLLVSASSNKHIRKIIPLCYYILKLGFYKCTEIEDWGVFNEFLQRNDSKMSFSDRRLLCVVASHSGFSSSQMQRLKELCDNYECLADVMQCLNV